MMTLDRRGVRIFNPIYVPAKPSDAVDPTGYTVLCKPNGLSVPSIQTHDGRLGGQLIVNFNDLPGKARKESKLFTTFILLLNCINNIMIAHK